MYHSSLSVFMTNNTPSGVKKQHESTLSRKVAKWPQFILSNFLSFFFFFSFLRQTSSKLGDFHDGFHAKQQHFTPSSALAQHCTFSQFSRSALCRPEPIVLE